MIVEFILEDGEVISNDSPDFDFKLLKNVSFAKMEQFYLKKKIIALLKENQKKTANKSGVSDVDILNLLSRETIFDCIEQLKQKDVVVQRQGVNNQLFFINDKLLKKS
jgi:hypothetical protein